MDKEKKEMIKDAFKRYVPLLVMTNGSFIASGIAYAMFGSKTAYIGEYSMEAYKKAYIRWKTKAERSIGSNNWRKLHGLPMRRTYKGSR